MLQKNTKISGRTRIGNELPRKVGIIYKDTQKYNFLTEAQFITAKDAKDDACLLGNCLTILGISVVLYPGNESLPYLLKQDRPDLVINLVDCVTGGETISSVIPGVLGFLGIPYPGAGILGRSFDANKFLIKRVLHQNGIPVPKHQLVYTQEEHLDPGIRFPVISKLNTLHHAIEINQDAISENEIHLRARLRWLMQTYRQPVLIEEFVLGKDITAVMFEKIGKKVYMAEKVFHDDREEYPIASFDDQWINKEDPPYCFKKYVNPFLEEHIKKAFYIARMADYGSFNIRLDSSGHYFFTGTNCSPAILPKGTHSTLSVILDLYGVSFQTILKELLWETMQNAPGKLRFPMPFDRKEEVHTNEESQKRPHTGH